MRLTQAFVVLALTLHAVSAVPVHVPFEAIVERDYPTGPSDEYQPRSTNAGEDEESSAGRRDVYVLRSAPTTVDAALWSRGLDPVEEEDEADRRDLSEAEEDEEARDSDDADEAAIQRSLWSKAFRSRRRRKQFRKMGSGLAMGGATLASTALMDPAMLMDMAGAGAGAVGPGAGMMMRRSHEGATAQAEDDGLEERSPYFDEDADLYGRDFDEDDDFETRDFDNLDTRAKHGMFGNMFGKKWRMKRRMKRNKGKIGLAAGGVGLLAGGAAYQQMAGGGGLADAVVDPAALSPAAMSSMGQGGPAGPGAPGPADPAMLPARSLEAVEADIDAFEGRDLDFDTHYSPRDLDGATLSPSDLDKRGSGRSTSGRWASGSFPGHAGFTDVFGSSRRRSRSRSRNSGSFGSARNSFGSFGSFSSLSSKFGSRKKKSFMQKHGKKMIFGGAAVAGLGLTGMALKKAQAGAAGGAAGAPTDPAAAGVDPAAAGVDPSRVDPSMVDPATGMAPRSLNFEEFDERDFADLDSDLADERDEADDSFEERGDDEDSFDERDLLEDDDVYERSSPKAEKEPILILI
jgi:hypothetical protein